MKRLLFTCCLMAMTCPAFADNNFDWSGPYVGVQGNLDNSFLQITDLVTASGSNSAFSGGVDMGYNFSSDNFVYGAEIDANFITGSQIDVAAKDTYRAQPSWYSTARARVGFSSKNVLFYGTGGLAFGDMGVQNISSGLRVGPALQFGWVVGTGVEVAVSPKISLKAELLHINLGQQEYYFQDNVARLGINFHF